MVTIGLRVPVELADAIDAAAARAHATRSALIRGLIEDGVDDVVLPPTRQDELDLELERLNAIARG